MSDSRPGDDPPPPPPAPPGARPDDHGAPPQPYATGEYGAATPPPQNGMGTAALVLGLVGLVFSVVFFPLGFVLAVIGLVLGLLGLKRVKRGIATNRGMALSGTVLSVLALLVCIGWGVAIGVLINKTQDCNDPDLSRSEQRQCVEDELGSFSS